MYREWNLLNNSSVASILGERNWGIHRVRRTCIDHEDFAIPVMKKAACKECVRKTVAFGPFLLIHSLKCISYVVYTDFFVKLDFQEFFPTVASHVYEYV